MSNIWGIKYSGNLPWLPGSTILFAEHGSRAYGLDTATSDSDFKGVCVPPKSYYIGLDRFEQAEFKDKERDAEAVIYELRKFIGLAAACNPNIIEVLWSPTYLASSAGKLLLDARQTFLSKRARYTFSGYAHSQLKRIKTHYGWIRFGESLKEPTRGQYGLPERTLIPEDQLKAVEAQIQKQLDRWNFKCLDVDGLDPAGRIEILAGISRIMAEMKLGTEDELWLSAARTVGVDANFIHLMDQERKYKAARRDWAAYQQWKASRNPTRAVLEEKHGYDTKHAMHLVRLMRMCGEILVDHRVNVLRPDREELLAIRNGAWSYERLIEYAEEEDKKMDAKYQASTLRNSSDIHALGALCQKIVEEAHQ